MTRIWSQFGMFGHGLVTLLVTTSNSQRQSGKKGKVILLGVSHQIQGYELAQQPDPEVRELEERQKRQFYEHLRGLCQQHDISFVAETNRSDLESHELEKWDNVRECAWVERLAETNATLSLLICGTNHVGPIDRLLTQRGYEVVTEDLRDQEWYVEDYLDFLQRPGRLNFGG